MSSNFGLPTLSSALEDVRVRAALALLEGAFRCSRLLGRSPWDFAFPADELQKTGAADCQLDLLVTAGLLDRRAAQPWPKRTGVAKGRVPQARGEPAVSFVLTARGAGIAGPSLGPVATAAGATGGSGGEDGAPRPSWEGRVFSYGGQVLKVSRGTRRSRSGSWTSCSRRAGRRGWRTRWRAMGTPTPPNGCGTRCGCSTAPRSPG